MSRSNKLVRLDYTRAVVKGVAFKKMLDLMSWRHQQTYEEAVATAIDNDWQNEQAFHKVRYNES